MMYTNGSDHQLDEAMLDLLIKQFAEGLTESEQRMLAAMDEPSLAAQARSIEQTAVAISLAFMRVPETLPLALRAKLAQQAAEYFAESTAVDEKVLALRSGAENTSTMRKPTLQVREIRYEWLAAAACLVLAIAGWVRPRPISTSQLTTKPVTVAAPMTQEQTASSIVAKERDSMLARSETFKVELIATKDPAGRGVRADVVWDSLAQTGFLHVAGLKANDPNGIQYQAWIFDAGRDNRYPVDCAVFDVPSDNSEVIVRLHAELPVRLAKAFAVTVEKPGGVVVSDRAHVVVLGATS